ncbi:MAG: hypothetical protein HFJ72_06020 [Adlercreutzia sp.]|nr:hypothetical protein [Adlercreutzia sp.]
MARWAPLAIVGLVLAFLWFFPLADESATRGELDGAARVASQAEVAAGEVGAETASVSREPIVINSLEASSPGVSEISSGEGSHDGSSAAEDNAASEQNSAKGLPGTVRSSDGSPYSVSRAFSSSPEEYDYSRWGYASYGAYEAEHPLEARVSYARLWTGRVLNAAQPTGCSQCSRKSETTHYESPVPDSIGPVLQVVEKPDSGFIFESVGKGRNPQLTVKAPDTTDAFVKLKDAETGETCLSFYVSAGTTVAACVPARECLVYYALGEEWYGPDEAFGEQGLYAKSDERLRFADPGNSYTYTLNVEGGNVSPVMIDRTEFC